MPHSYGLVQILDNQQRLMAERQKQAHEGREFAKLAESISSRPATSPRKKRSSNDRHANGASVQGDLARSLTPTELRLLSKRCPSATRSLPG